MVKLSRAASEAKSAVVTRELNKRRFAVGRSKLLELEDRIFTEPKLQICGFGVAWTWALFAGWLLFSGWMIGSLRSIDFCWIWVSGNLANSSNPALVYDPIAFT